MGMVKQMPMIADNAVVNQTEAARLLGYKGNSAMCWFEAKGMIAGIPRRNQKHYYGKDLKRLHREYWKS